jgi:hypothetical protein
MNEIISFSMPRSGHHAVLFWLFCHIERQLVTDSKNCKRYCIHGPTSALYYYQHFVPANMPPNLQLLGIDMEDYTVNQLIKIIPKWEKLKRLNNINIEKSLRLMVLRDPFNNLASIYSLYVKLVKKNNIAEINALFKRMPKVWVSHAREFVYRKHLKGTFFILYNRWCKDKDYRRDIITKLGIPFTDIGLNRVPRAAGGSSFDGVKYQGKAYKMRTLERWKEVADIPAYRNSITNEMKDLSSQIFGLRPF